RPDSAASVRTRDRAPPGDTAARAITATARTTRMAQLCGPDVSRVLALEQRRLALADTDAQRGQPVPAAAPAQLVEHRHAEARPAHAQRMAQREGAAVQVHPLRVETQLADDGQALRRERLVQLDEVELARVDPCTLEQLAHGRHRPDAHHTRVDTGGGAAGEGGERVDTELARPLLARDHQSRGAVVDPARVPRRDRAVAAEGRPARRE